MNLKNSEICIVSPLGYTGIAYYDHSLCQSLSELGANVTLITSKQRITSPSMILYLVKNFFVDTYGEVNRIKKGLNYIIGMFRTAKFVLENRFKVIHFQILELPFIDLIFFAVLKILGLKIVFTPHDICSLKGSGNYFLRKQYLLSDVVIVHNNANKNFMVEKYNISGNKITIIAHGNYEYFLHDDITRKIAREKIGISQDVKLILLFGNIRLGKGIDTAVSSMQYLTDIEKAKLLIAGKACRTFSVDMIKNQIPQEHLSNKVVFRDYFINDELVEFYYKAADIVLVPYEEGYESGVLKYAFSCGIPVVVSGMKEFSDFAINGENCLIFETKNAMDLALKIKHFLKEPVFAEKVARNAKILSDTEWNWKKVAEETVKAYEECT